MNTEVELPPLHGVHPVVWKEGRLTVYALKEGASSPVEDFLESDAVKESEYISIHATCRMIGEKGVAYRDGRRFKKLLVHCNRPILEFKKNQVRIGCMWLGSGFGLLLLYGCIKKAPAWSRGDIAQLQHKVEFYLRNWSDAD